MIINNGNGWRDLTSEGPGFTYNAEKEGWSVTQTAHKVLFEVAGPSHKRVAEFVFLKDAKEFVDRRIEEIKAPIPNMKVYEIAREIRRLAKELISREQEYRSGFVQEAVNRDLRLAHRIMEMSYE